MFYVSDHNGVTELADGKTLSYKAGVPFEAKKGSVKHVKGISAYVETEAESTEEEESEK